MKPSNTLYRILLFIPFIGAYFYIMKHKYEFMYQLPTWMYALCWILQMFYFGILGHVIGRIILF